jgi:hypothetical protein
LMGYHIRFGHIPFDRLQQAARHGILLRRIADCLHQNVLAAFLPRQSVAPGKTKHRREKLEKLPLNPGIWSLPTSLSPKPLAYLHKVPEHSQIAGILSPPFLLIMRLAWTSSTHKNRFSEAHPQGKGNF